jgi:hypothetical protein
MSKVLLIRTADPGAANVAKEALVELGMEVELRTLRSSAYTGGHDYIEVYVPEERLTDAQHELARLQLEVHEAVMTQAAASVPEPSQPAPPRGLSGRGRLLLLVPLIAVLLALTTAIVVSVVRENRHATAEP